jgi:hypothetical protein
VRLVELIDGAVELRWTWLPYWLGANAKLRTELEAELRDIALLNGLTESPEDLDALNRTLCRRIQARFPAFQGLGAALGALSGVQGPPEPLPGPQKV